MCAAAALAILLLFFVTLAAVLRSRRSQGARAFERQRNSDLSHAVRSGRPGRADPALRPTACRSVRSRPRRILLLLAWLLVSVALSTDPGTSARRFILSFTTFLLAAMLPWLTRGLRSFTPDACSPRPLVLVLSYVGVLVVPHLTIHQSRPTWSSRSIAGDWRGIYGHKNVAAGMMAIFVYVGWFVARTGRPIAGGLVSVAAFIFLLNFGRQERDRPGGLVVAVIAYLRRPRPVAARESADRVRTARRSSAS